MKDPGEGGGILEDLLELYGVVDIEFAKDVCAGDATAVEVSLLTWLYE